MYRRPSKQKEFIMRVIVYTGMTLAVLALVTFTIFYMLGYRLDFNNGRIQQNAFVQFGSSPSGATVTIDGKAISARTPSKSAVSAGEHTFVMWRDGYETWTKAINTKAGTLTWLNYALLVPKDLTVESVAEYSTLHKSLASPKGRSMLVQKSKNTPVFTLVDLTADAIKSTDLTLGADIYSEAETKGVAHEFTMSQWDSGGRYVLVEHSFGDKNEWLVLDTQNPAQSKNITTTFDIAISNIYFSGTSGNDFYILGSTDIRKLDLSAGTISRPLVNNVTSFSVYDSNTITFVGLGNKGTTERTVGIYREGDEKASTIRTVRSSAKTPLHIATTRYFNENYIAISEGSKVDILSGSYPDPASGETTSLKAFASFNSEKAVERLGFSPTGEHVFVQSGAYFASYDLEYQAFASSTVAGDGAVPTLRWLNDNYLWSDRDGSLTIREFDGANMHTINSVQAGQSVALSPNGRYLYSFGTTDKGFQLQRVRMILP